MPKHRNLILSTFLHATNPDLVERYFLRFFQREALPPYLVGMNADYVLHILDQTDDPLQTAILEDFHRINDICYRDLAIRAAQRFGVVLRPDEKLQATVLRLFLDFPSAFEFAWALYSYTASYASISQHWLQRHDTHADSEAIADFKEDLQSFFAGQARGNECRVYVYDEPDEMVIPVLHGSHLRTVACLQGHEISFNQFRLACEDVLIYDKRRAVLSVKVSTPKDREYYVRCFARLILGDEALADHPERDRIYTLEPLERGDFDWASNGRIAAVQRVERKFKLPEPEGAALTIHGEGSGVAAMTMGELVEVKLRFTLDCDGKKETVTSTIASPCFSDLLKKRHAETIVRYLKDKGVLLR